MPGAVRPMFDAKYENTPTSGITTSYTIGDVITPVLDTKFEIRRFELPESQPEGAPGYCKDGGCWSCLTSMRAGVSTGSTIETCNHGLKVLMNEQKGIPRPSEAQLLGNWNTWKFVKGNLGPDGVQLYDLYSIGADDHPWSEDFVPIYQNIAIAKVTINSQNTNSDFARFRDNPSLGTPVIFIEACSGKSMKYGHGPNAESCFFDYQPAKVGVWYIRGTAPDDHIFSNADPISI